MKILTLFLILTATLCYAHDEFPKDSTDREHLSGAALKGYLHGHIYTPKGYSYHSQWGFWDFDPDVDNAWEKTKANWEQSGCTTTDENGKTLYNHDCYYDWIREGNLKATHPTDFPPVNHRHCYGNGEEHFHRYDANGFWHGIDHNDIGRVGIYTGLHIHPKCEDDTPPPAPCVDCEKPTPLTPDGQVADTSLAGLGLIPSQQRLIAQCAVGWSKGKPKVIIQSIDFDKGKITLHSPDDVDITGYQLRLSKLYNSHTYETYEFTDNDRWEHFQMTLCIEDLPKSEATLAGQTVPGFDYRLMNGLEIVDIARTCFLSLPVGNHIHRVILDTEWEYYHRSVWQSVSDEAPSAPRFQRQLTTTWAALKHRD